VVYLIKKKRLPILEKLFQKSEAEVTLPNTFHEASTAFMSKSGNNIKNHRRNYLGMRAKISHEHGFKNSQQNICKLNPTNNTKVFFPQLNGICSKYARLAQNINHCNPLYE
jgi:hypothetical protein